MKAALMYGPNDIRVEEVERPACPEGGFILRVDSVGLCGSDIRNLTTNARNGDYPFIYGHEIIGTVDEVSPTCSEYKVGERLYVYPADHCLKCEPCRLGHSEMCENSGDYTNRQGGFADFYAVSAEQVSRDSIYRLPDNVDSDRAVMSEPLTSVYACQENINVSLGQTVVILGAGPIGCLHSKLAKMRGAKKVIMVDINDRRLEQAPKYGTDVTINSSEVDPVERVLEETDGKGAEVIISANPSTSAQQQALLMAKACGTVVFFGGVAKGTMTELDTNVIHYKGLWIYGHYGSSSIQVQRAFELATSDEFGADDFITHRLPLSKINEAIELTRTGEAIKVVLHPNED